MQPIAVTLKGATAAPSIGRISACYPRSRRRAGLLTQPMAHQMKIAYADPPYPGCAHRYRDHPDYAGEVDHAALIAHLDHDFDGWVLHTHTPAIAVLAPLLPPGARWGAWVKTFA